MIDTSTRPSLPHNNFSFRQSDVVMQTAQQLNGVSLERIDNKFGERNKTPKRSKQFGTSMHIMETRSIKRARQNSQSPME